MIAYSQEAVQFWSQMSGVSAMVLPFISYVALDNLESNPYISIL